MFTQDLIVWLSQVSNPKREKNNIISSGRVVLGNVRSGTCGTRIVIWRYLSKVSRGMHVKTCMDQVMLK